MRNAPFARWCLPGAVLLFAACGSTSDQKVEASSQVAYDNWFARQSESLGSDKARVLRLAQQEIKLNLMATGNASGSAAIGEAYLRKVDGLTTRQLMELGLQDRITRLTADRDAARQLLDQNSHLQAREGSERAAANLASHLEEEKNRVEKDEADLSAARSDLAQVQAKPSS